MIAFSPNALSATAQTHLATLQAEVDAATAISRENGYQKAEELWRNRKNRLVNQPIWAEMKAQRAFFPHLNLYFEQNPETLTWA